MLIALLTAAHAAEGLCPADGPQAVDDAVATLFETYRAVDELAFDRTQKNLVALVSCLDRVPTGPQIARLHQAMGLSAFVNGQSKAARRALASARMLDPGWRLDPAQFPESHPLQELYAAASDPGPVTDLGDIAPEAWVVDGFESTQAPVDRGFLLQVKRDGAIVWSGYVFDRVEVPDRGQSVTRSAFDTPHQLWLGAGGVGRLLSVRQDARSVGWSDQEGASAGGGLSVAARWTPVSAFGVEAAGSLLGPVDPIAGGGGQPSGAVVLTAGGGAWVGDVQPHGGVRLGAALDRFRAWTDAGAPTPTPLVSTVGSAVLGLEGGVRAETFRAGLSGDVLLAAVTEPWQVRVRGEGGARLTGPLALEGGLELRTGGLAYEDGPRDAGTRRDTDLRFAVGVGLWY